MTTDLPDPAAREPVAAIYIPDDGRDAISLVYVNLDDGGLAALDVYLDGGEPEEVNLVPSWVAFVREDGMRTGLPQNVRATRLLAKGLGVGHWVGGPALLCGQLDDGGLGPLPDGLNLASIEAALTVIHDV